MSTVTAGVLAEAGTGDDERDPVPEHHAEQRVTDEVAPRWLLNEAVAAVAGVFRASVALGDGMHMVPKQAAEIPHAFGELPSPAVGVVTGREQQWMAAANTGVLGMAVSFGNPLVGVVAEEARQRVADADRPTIVAQTGPAAACARTVRDLERLVMNGVAPERARQPADHRHLPSGRCRAPGDRLSGTITAG